LPGEILGRVADRCARPVEHCDHRFALVVDEDVAEPEITMGQDGVEMLEGRVREEAV
jgi:hypothetical protein